MDGFFEDSFKLHDMIENDIRSGRNEFGNYFCSDLSLNPGSHMDLNPMDGIDRELSDDGTTGWFNSSHLLNGSTDFDSIGGLMVNPRTALPLSDPVPLSSSVSSSLSESSSISSVSESQASPPSASSSLSASILNHAITSNSDMKDVNLTVDVPTPSPNTHSASSQAQIYSSHDADGQDNTDSPKLKSKNKNSKSNNQNNNENTYPKPAYSYSCLIAMALKNSRTGSLPVNEIYDFMTENFPYFKTAPNGWKNSVRHNLSLNKCFEKIEKPAGNNTQRKGYLWAMNPAKIEKMEEELQKWGSKDPDAIRKSMANPERLELIEKGELRGTDSESEVENMSTSQLDEDEEAPVEEKENEVKVQVTTIGNDLLNNDYSALGDSGNIDNCLHELEIQKGMWDNIYDERLQFLTDSPISPLSPKNSETMDDEASLDSPPSSQKAYVQANIIYKCAPRTPTSDPSNRLIAHASSPSKGAACNV